jgi:putative hydrolase of the HAD superfamily
MATEFIYFDVGNVLLTFSHVQMCQQMATAAGVDVEIVERLLFEDREVARLLMAFETGHVGPDEFYEQFCRGTGSRPDPNKLRLAAVDIFTPIESVWEIVTHLHEAGHRLGLLSNSNAMHWEFITDGHFPLLAAPATERSPFETAVASHEAGAMKPDHQIYHVALDRAGVPAEAVLFFDDRPENVIAAHQLGIDAVQFTPATDLLAELAARDIVLPL